MSEENLSIVKSACQFLSDRNVPALFELIHEEGHWTVPYRVEDFKYGGTRDKNEEFELLSAFLSGFSIFSFKMQSIVANDDRVMVEATSAGVGPGSATYNNKYSMAFIIKDKKIYSVREFFDPFEVSYYEKQILAGA